MYLQDLKAVDARIDALRASGVRGANRSSLIRIALEALPDAVLRERLQQEVAERNARREDHG